VDEHAKRRTVCTPGGQGLKREHSVLLARRFNPAISILRRQRYSSENGWYCFADSLISIKEAPRPSGFSRFGGIHKNGAGWAKPSMCARSRRAAASWSTSRSPRSQTSRIRSRDGLGRKNSSSSDQLNYPHPPTLSLSEGRSTPRHALSSR
jgi:hypothetical protein